MRRLRKRPRPTAVTVGRGKLNEQANNMQTPGYSQVAADWRSMSECFLSGYYCHLAEQIPVRYPRDFVLDRRHFPCADHWVVCQALIGHAELGERPFVWSVRQAADRLGYLPDKPDLRFDLISRLPFAEPTPARLRTIAGLMLNYARRRDLIQLLHCMNNQLCDPLSDIDEIATQIATSATTLGSCNLVLARNFIRRRRGYCEF